MILIGRAFREMSKASGWVCMPGLMMIVKRQDTVALCTYVSLSLTSFYNLKARDAA